MFKKVIIALMIGSIALSGVGAAQVSQLPQNATDTAENVVDEVTCKQVDSDLRLCDKELDDNTAVLTIRSDKLKRVTLSDAGAFLSGGEVNQKSVVINEGRNEVRMPVTVVDGFTGVSISTDEVLYAVPLKKRTTLIGGPWTQQDVQTAAGAAAISTSLIGGLVLWRRLTGETDEADRLA